MIRSRARRFSQAHHHALRQSLHFVADIPSGAKGTPKISALDKREMAANGDQLPERIQEKEERI